MKEDAGMKLKGNVGVAGRGPGGQMSVVMVLRNAGNSDGGEEHRESRARCPQKV